MLHEVHFISKEVGRSGVAKRHRSQIMSVRVHSSNFKKTRQIEAGISSKLPVMVQNSR